MELSTSKYPQTSPLLGGVGDGLFLLVFLLLFLSGCKTVQPAADLRYVSPVPVLERNTEPVVRIPQKDPDMRLISAYQPTGQDQLMRPGFRHPAGSRKVKEVFFQDVPLEIAAELLNEVGGVNLMLQGPVAGRGVRLFLQDVSLSTAVEALLRGNELWYRTDGNVTAVMSEEAFANSMVFQRSEKIQAFFMRYTNAKDMAALLSTMLGPDVDYREMSGESVYGHLEARAVGAGATTSTTSSALTDDERKLLVQLGEAETVSQIEDAVSSVGRRLPAVITVFKKNNSIVVRSTDEGLLRHITGLIREMDTPIRQVLLEVKIVRLDLGDGFESFFDLSYSDIGNTSDRNISRDGLFFSDFATLGAVSSLAETFSYVFATDILRARLELFAQANRLQTLSSPFLMTADNAEVRFFVGEQVPLRTGVEKETVSLSDLRETVIFTVTVENRELGTDLEIKSFINADRTITLEIVANIESPKFNVNSITLINDMTGTPVTFPLDGLDKNELRSIMAVPSGNTVALGGFIRLEDRDFEQKVPLLGDIPALGYLFKRVERRASRTETVILVTPHIIGAPGEGADTTRRFLEKNSRVLDEAEEAKERVIPEGMLFKPVEE
ncbi:general secretion pathway protein D [Desulfonatronum zhilinae]|nr:general secretion pathway protein D [Desulfonatronum zhilinae]